MTGQGISIYRVSSRSAVSTHPSSSSRNGASCTQTVENRIRLQLMVFLVESSPLACFSLNCTSARACFSRFLKACCVFFSFFSRSQSLSHSRTLILSIFLSLYLSFFLSLFLSLSSNHARPFTFRFVSLISLIVLSIFLFKS